uniref:GAF domain-containing protein n=1 Tax=Citrifermentans bremense TaxID=60035 RepID=UPI0004243D76|nr:GAF domain-containing protein [Citrifermentans bremense]
MANAVKKLEPEPAPGTESAEEQESQADRGRSISKSHLVNRLNYLNFQDLTVLVSLRHEAYDDAISLRACPQPCAGERLDLVWAEIPSLKQLLKTYRFEYLLIADGRKYLVVNSELLTINEEGVSLLLPAACREFQARKIKRHPAREISVQLIQHGVTFDCQLVDFTPVSVRATGSLRSAETLMWVNTESPVHLRLVRDGEVIYSGNFSIHSRQLSGKSCSFVLRQLDSNIQRYRTKKYRNARQQLVPSPNIVFEHPLIDKRVNRKMADISGTGFAVEEGEGDSVLMAGMMLPDLKISFAHGFSLKCLAQVVSRNAAGGEEEGSVRCGLAILDMEIHDHVKLLSILHQVANRKSYVSAEVDLDELWDFFFETGFIYPGKYAHFQANKESIKETYAKLYTHTPQIARHFIYLDRGIILGHLAMVRFYPNSWLIHHHAARKSVSIKAGLAVLDQVSRYLNELESFAFAHLRYVYCYYRPDNKFPSRVFGGFAKKHQDQSSCSLDLFSYAFHHGNGGPAALPKPWEFGESSRFDVAALNLALLAMGETGLLTWVFPSSLCILLLVALATETSEKKAIKESLWSTRDSIEALLDQINLNYNNAMLTHEIGQRLGNYTKIEEMLFDVVQIMRYRLEYDRGMILLADGCRKRLELRASYGYKDEELACLNSLPFPLENREQGDVYLECFRGQRPFLVNELSSGSVGENTLACAHMSGTRAFICCPIVADGASLGVLTVENVQLKRPLVERDISLIMGTASVLGISIRNCELIGALETATEELELRVAKRTEDLEKSRQKMQEQHEELVRTYFALEEETAQRLSALEELARKERMLLQQNRLAALGEMISNIAHQWRQPLNELGLIVQELPIM